jgi:hypothetical protein
MVWEYFNDSDFSGALWVVRPVAEKDEKKYFFLGTEESAIKLTNVLNTLQQKADLCETECSQLIESSYANGYADGAESNE